MYFPLYLEIDTSIYICGRALPHFRPITLVGFVFIPLGKQPEVKMYTRGNIYRWGVDVLEMRIKGSLLYLYVSWNEKGGKIHYCVCLNRESLFL